MTEAKPKKKTAAKQLAAPAAKKAASPRTKEAAPIAAPSGPATGVHHLAPASGATHAKKRVGPRSGLGPRQDGRTRAQGREVPLGVPHKRGFEGGQMPLHRRVPEARLPQPVPGEYDVVNLDSLGAASRPDTSHARGPARARPVREAREPVKILGRGEIEQGAHGARAQVQRQGRGEDREGRRTAEVIETGRSGRELDVRILAETSSPSPICASGSASRSRCWRSTGSARTFRRPGVNADGAGRVFTPQAGDAVRPLRHVLGRQPVGGCRSSRSASCRTSARRSSCSSCTVVWPYLERLSKEGELGRRKITQYTRYGTILLSVFQSPGIALFLEKQQLPVGSVPRPPRDPGAGFLLMTVLTLTTGTRLRHVARRADHRARHRQRHVAHHLRGHRRRPAARDRRALRQSATGRARRSSRCSRSCCFMSSSSR